MSGVAAAAATAAARAPGEVITFYSYKGGTGRSMLVANVAWQLASAGSRVLIIDWDLEAPGLHRYFKPFLGDDPELHEQPGVMQWLIDYWDAALDEPDKPMAQLVADCADPRHYVRKLELEGWVPGGIDLLCAGRQDRFYAEAVADFDFTQLFQKLRGEAFIDAAKSILVGPEGYDFVLVDSRTGVSDTSGFCTVVLADTLVVCFTYNNQSVIGASEIARDIKLQAEQRRADGVANGQARRFRLFAVPSRVDELDQDRLERRQHIAWTLFADLLTDVPLRQQPEYWVSVQIRNQGLFAYEEVLAACMNRAGDPQSVLGSVTQLTKRLTDGAFVEPPHLSDEQRRQLRDLFATASVPRLPPARTAWERFVGRLSDPDARSGLLQACFPLLIQLVTSAGTHQVPQGDPSSQGSSAGSSAGSSGGKEAWVRTMVLESELTADERRLAELLTSVQVTLRRVTEDRQRALMLTDDSLLAEWEGLRSRLQPHADFIAARERIRGARRSWEAAGRTLESLRSMQGEFARWQPADEERAWLGKANLQFLGLVQELQNLEMNHQQTCVLAAQAAAQADTQSRERLDESRSQMIAIEQQRVELDQRLQTASARERRARRFQGLLVGSVLTCGALAGVGYVATQRAQERASAATAAANAAAAATIAAKAEVRQLQASLDTVASQRAQEAALMHYGQGNAALEKWKRSRKDAELAESINAFSSALRVDPTFAEAYRGRALARGNSRSGRDVPAELADWAKYYDLNPSLQGRTQLVVRAMAEPEPATALISAQLKALLQDAALPEARDASTSRSADQLATALDKHRPRLSDGLRVELNTTIKALRAREGEPQALNKSPTSPARAAPTATALTARSSASTGPTPASPSDFGAAAGTTPTRTATAVISAASAAAASTDALSVTAPPPATRGIATVPRPTPVSRALFPEQKAPPPAAPEPGAKPLNTVK